MDIAENIAHLYDEMDKACEKSGRKRQEITVCLATKTIEPSEIIQAYHHGLIVSGENKMQELQAKYEALQSYPLERHFIGHLQSNKAKEAVEYASCIQSIDRLDLLKKVNRFAKLQNKTQKVLIQVNTSFEPSKSGLDPDAFLSFMEAIRESASCTSIHVQGLMTLGLHSKDETMVRKGFAHLRQLQERAKAEGLLSAESNVLSMGMSGDFSWAIQEGATMIRVGSMIFGQRKG